MLSKKKRQPGIQRNSHVAKERKAVETSLSHNLVPAVTIGRSVCLSVCLSVRQYGGRKFVCLSVTIDGDWRPGSKSPCLSGVTESGRWSSFWVLAVNQAAIYGGYQCEQLRRRGRRKEKKNISELWLPMNTLRLAVPVAGEITVK